MRILLVALLSMVVSGFFYLGSLDDDAGEPAVIVEEEPVVAPVLHEYLMFDRPVSKGNFIRKEDLRWVHFDPQDVRVPSYAVLRADQRLKDFDGALVMRDANKDDFVNLRMFLLPQESRFLASVLEPGKRAISIEISAVTGNSGLVQPGDRIDLILFTDLNAGGRDDGKSGFIARTILEDMRVIAINRKIAYLIIGNDQEDSSLRDAESPLPKKSTATLEVTPRQAEIITVARRMGTLSLSLRSNFERPASGTPSSPAAGEAVRSHDVIQEFPEPKKNVEIVEFFGAEKRRQTAESNDRYYNRYAQ